MISIKLFISNITGLFLIFTRNDRTLNMTRYSKHALIKFGGYQFTVLLSATTDYFLISFSHFLDVIVCILYRYNISIEFYSKYLQEEANHFDGCSYEMIEYGLKLQ